MPAVNDIAALLDEPVSFLRRERRARLDVASHALAGSDAVVCFRHGTHDIEVLHEIFVRGAYRLPGDVEALLLCRGRALHVADVGANVGLFSVYVQTVLPVRTITAVEPDEENLAVLEACARANDRTAWRITRACAASRAGVARFVAEQFAMSHVAADDERCSTVDVPCVDMFALVADADLIKIDIEGGEWDILADGRLSSLAARAIVLEFHPRACPESRPRSAAERFLRGAGYSTGHVEEELSGRGMLWAWR